MYAVSSTNISNLNWTWLLLSVAIYLQININDKLNTSQSTMVFGPAALPSPRRLLETQTIQLSPQIKWKWKHILTRSSVYVYIHVWETLL